MLSRFRSSLIVALCAGLFAVTALPANAGKKEDIEALQIQVAELQRQLSALAANTGQTNANATVQISQIQAENQRLTGELEALRNDMRQLTSRLDTMSRIIAGENFSGLGPDGIDGVAGSGDGRFATGDPNALTQTGGASSSTALPPGGETVNLPLDSDAAYEYASSLLLSGDYTRARIAFEMYVEAFPNARQTPDARFRLGEIYLATGANSDAAQAFINHIKLYPNDPRAPEAYLKLGTAFSRMEQTDQACNIFKQVRSKYPNASPIILQRTDVEMKRINCR